MSDFGEDEIKAPLKTLETRGKRERREHFDLAQAQRVVGLRRRREKTVVVLL